MEKTVEFKIRIPQAKRWEDTPVYLSKTLTGAAEEIERQAQEIAEGIAFSQRSDVRWNFEGRAQGHYVDEIFPEKPTASANNLSSLRNASRGPGLAV